MTGISSPSQIASHLLFPIIYLSMSILESCNEHLVTTTCIGLSLIDGFSLLEIALGNFHDLRLVPIIAKHHSGIKRGAGVN